MEDFKREKGETILKIEELHTYFYKENLVIKAVEGVTLSLKEGEVLGLVGESGCGKTVTAYSVMRLIPPQGKIVKGKIYFKGKDLLTLTSLQMRKVRGKEISMVFQEPRSALNPLYTIGFQIAEAIKSHNPTISSADLQLSVIELLKKVGIAQPEIRIRDYPHNLSGGQAQRVMIAMAIVNNPSLLIADEPTSNLDVTVQAQIIDLLLQLKKEIRMAILFITHDLILCAQIADVLAVMYAGKIVELADREELFNNPLHPYTKALFSSLPGSKKRKQKLAVIKGEVVDPAFKPKGCYFYPRCSVRDKVCSTVYPDFRKISPQHWVSCLKVK